MAESTDQEIGQRVDEIKQEACVATRDCGTQCWLKQLCQTKFEHDNSFDKILKSANVASKGSSSASSLYTPLLPWQIRVLRILPGNTPDLLRCELLVADLICFPGIGLVASGDIVQYEALSYVWGSPNQKVAIECNGILRPCGRKLVEALIHFRLQEKPRLLWADQLCINQDDSVEKSAQVRIMFTIYQKAHRVIAWLGMPTDGEIPILSILPKLSELSDNEQTFEQTHDKSCIEQLPIVSEALVLALRRPWFARTWIRQEVFANRETIVMYGDSHSSIQQLYSGIDVLRKLLNAPERFNAFQKEPNYVCLNAMRVGSGRPGTALRKTAPPRPISNGLWMSGLLAGCRFGATDDRDRVYGVIGMLQANTKSWLQAYCNELNLPGVDVPPVDYSKSVTCVYQDIVRFLINRHESLLPLLVFQTREHPDTVESTWALNLDHDTTRWYLATHLPRRDLAQVPSQPLKRNPGAWKSLISNPQQLVHWESFQGRYKPPPSSFDDSPVLRLPGFLIGKVGDDIPDHNIFHGLDFGLNLQRSPMSAEVEYKLDSRGFGKEVQVQALGATHANVATLIQECDQKVITLLPEQNLTDPDGSISTVLCTSLLVSSQVGRGDIVVLLHGSSLPILLRRADPNKAEQYAFLGPAIWLTLPPDEANLKTAHSKMMAKHEGLLGRAKKQYEMHCDCIATLDILEKEFALV